MPSPNERPLRVCSFESRRASEMKSLIERNGATATIAPSMREIPLDDNPAVFKFVEELVAGRIDIVVFMTGVGATALLAAVETRYSREDFLAALARTVVVVRGPKPTAVLRGWDVRIAHRAPEPNTWREVYQLLESTGPLAGRRIAIQEYGQPSVELYNAIESRQGTVVPVPVYQWALPHDLAPLRSAIHGTIAGDFDLMLFTSAQQLNHVLAVAEEDGLREKWLEAANRTSVIASIGPTASENLRAQGVRVDVEPTRSTMGALVKEAVAAAGPLLAGRAERTR
ncbi:MAG TPA: uroporphyrinogen-III synthase [Schlesneria sp.]